ncbi:DUF4136 domain-containing protein [Trinickia violacea]|uniref:DUF4136 domain-containing protein n=1 Tax=Trinickia violacea TaxID=2571746 RepID=UPI0020C7E1C8|nr:DUF4136 domain-containing protein [Trinickia violacea]
MSNVKRFFVCAAFAAAMLSGCADVNTDVRASGVPAGFGGERTYELVRAPSQGESPLQTQYEALVRDELAQRGFVGGQPSDGQASSATAPAVAAQAQGQGGDASSQAAGHARYLVSLAYETHPAAVRAANGECASAGCGDSSSSGFSWPGMHPFVHSLTLRFFERATGREVYRVTVSTRDHDADPLHASPYLVKSAFAQLPFADHEAWRVKLHPGEAGAMPGVVSVKPVEP